MTVQIDVGQATYSGRREHNEDCAAYRLGEGELGRTKGCALAIADGIGGSEGGGEAAQHTVHGVLNDYFSTPDTWEVPHALDKVIVPLNRWLRAQQSLRHAGVAATTLSTLVLRGRHFYIAHVGDSRVYRLRGDTLEQLTLDHVWAQPGMQHVLKRAVGLDDHLVIDYFDGPLQVDDVFVLVTDGVWEVLGDNGMHEILQVYRDLPGQAAQQLVDAVKRRNGHDNATAIVARIRQLPDRDILDTLLEGRLQGTLQRLVPGTMIDGFEVIRELHASRTSLLYQIRHSSSGQLLVLKTLQPQTHADPRAREGLLVEEWLLKRLGSHYFPQVFPLPPEKRSGLYYVMSWHEGNTLRQKLDAGWHFSVADCIGIGIRLAKGMGVLHRLNILHGDIKPENIHIDLEGKLRILDLGVASVTGLSTPSASAVGTHSYMAPELFDGAPASPQSDLYAAGVTLYTLLTRKYPYGEIEPFQRPRFGHPVPPTRYRAEIPLWLEGILLKAVEREPQQRFETAEELLVRLEKGERDPLMVQRRPLLADPSARTVWQFIALASLVLNLALLYLLVAQG